MNDPIVDEVWRIKDELAARFNYDLKAIYDHLKQRGKGAGRKNRTQIRHLSSSSNRAARQPGCPGGAACSQSNAAGRKPRSEALVRCQAAKSRLNSERNARRNVSERHGDEPILAGGPTSG